VTNSKASKPAVPEVREALERYLRDAGEMQRVHRVAATAAFTSADSLIARELVAEVIGETYDGTLAWDPSRIPLAAHIVTEVRRRGWRERQRRAKFVPLDGMSDAETPAVLIAPGTSDEDSASQTAFAEVFARELRAIAVGDREVLQLMALNQRGVVRKRDVLRAGFPAAAYAAARRRLVRLGKAVRRIIRIRMARLATALPGHADQLGDLMTQPLNEIRQRRSSQDDTSGLRGAERALRSGVSVRRRAA
jgi:hypothetical protein